LTSLNPWDDWLTQTADHVDAITNRLTQQTSTELLKDPKKDPSLARIDPETGHLTGGELCWVCYSTFTHKGRHLPAFRCCYWCLHYDKTQARKLGLKMLLPLMGWHCQPILPGHRFPTNSQTRQLLSSVWTASSLLEEWRQENVAREYALLVEPGQPPIHLNEWVRHFGYGWHRSKQQWWYFVDQHFPTLTALLND